MEYNTQPERDYKALQDQLAEKRKLCREKVNQLEEEIEAVQQLSREAGYETNRQLAALTKQIFEANPLSDLLTSSDLLRLDPEYNNRSKTYRDMILQKLKNEPIDKTYTEQDLHNYIYSVVPYKFLQPGHYLNIVDWATENDRLTGIY
jgi:hypothetical protein